MVDNIVSITPPGDTVERMQNELSRLSYKDVDLSGFSDKEINDVHAFFDECSNSLNRIPQLVDLMSGGMMQMADYLHEESIKYEQDYIDLSVIS